MVPVDQGHLARIRRALTGVVGERKGTAYKERLADVDMAGKTGTAQVSHVTPRGVDPDKVWYFNRDHAWFAGYTDCSDYVDEYPVCEGKQDLAIAVVVENIGEGSEYAAPIFRRMVQVYYWGSPQSLFPWEASYGVPRTPTPIGGIPTKTKKPDNN